MRLKSTLIRSWAAWSRILGFGCSALILGLAPVEAGTVLTVDFSPGQSFQRLRRAPGPFLVDGITKDASPTYHSCGLSALGRCRRLWFGFST